MNDESYPLSWDQLRRTESGIPWPALRAFADAVAADREVTRQLFEVYDQAYEAADQTGFVDLYVPAIFARAAPRLDDERRREIGSFLVERLVRAGEDDANISMEVLQAAAGTMGPVILPTVLDAIAAEPDSHGAWFHLWGLTALAAKSEDEALRDRVIQVCVDLLERADRGEAGLSEAAPAAWTLASLKCTEYTDLLQRLTEKPIERFWPTEYEDALKLLQDRLDYTPSPNPWEEPVEEWLASRCRMAEEEPAETTEYEKEAEEEDPEEPQVKQALLTRRADDYFEPLPEPVPQPRYRPPIPIVEHSPKPGRNAPCPCGSGKKYKKCHGRPDIEQTSGK